MWKDLIDLLVLLTKRDQSGLKESLKTLYQGGPSEKPQDGWGKSRPCILEAGRSPFLTPT